MPVSVVVSVVILDGVSVVVATDVSIGDCGDEDTCELFGLSVVVTSEDSVDSTVEVPES